MPHKDPQAKAEYARQYRAANREKIRENSKRYWQKNKARCAAANLKYRSENQDRVKELNQLWWAANKDRLVAEKYGLTLEEYQQMLDATEGKCPICSVELVFEGKSAARACVDHDHATGKIRGIVCSRCNLLIGKAKDDAALLMRAAEYLMADKP
jgi:hypothetical protein